MQAVGVGRSVVDLSRGLLVRPLLLVMRLGLLFMLSRISLLTLRSYALL